MKRHVKKKTQEQESREMLATVHAIVLTATLASPKVPISAMEAGVLRRQRARIRTAIHSSGRPRWRDLHTAARNFVPFVGIERRESAPVTFEEAAA